MDNTPKHATKRKCVPKDTHRKRTAAGKSVPPEAKAIKALALRQSDTRPRCLLRLT